MSRAVYALDVGGTKIAAALVGLDGTVLAESRCPTGAAGGGTQVLRNMAEALHALAAQAGGLELCGIGVSAAGVIDMASARVLDATDAMPGWAGTDFKAELGSRFGLPVAAANDVHCALLGELAHDAALAGRRGLVAMLTLGTGLGGALALDGRLLGGRAGLAGHVGRTLAWDTASQAPAPLDALVSGSALARFYRLAAPAITGTAAADDAPDGAAVMRRAAGGEPAALQAVDTWLDQLALLLHNLYWSLDPELVLLGGGVLDSRAQWWDALLARLHARQVPLPLAPALLGNCAGVRGAARLIIERLESA